MVTLSSELHQAATALNSVGPLHLLYLVIPPQSVAVTAPRTHQLDWAVLFDRVSWLSPEQANIVELIGFSDSYLARRAAGQTIRKVSLLLLFAALIFDKI